MAVTHPTAQWHTGCRRALTAGIYTGIDLQKNGAASNIGTCSQLRSLTSAAPTPEGLTAINAPTNCNRIYQIIQNIITLHNYAAIPLIFAHLIMQIYVCTFNSLILLCIFHTSMSDMEINMDDRLKLMVFKKQIFSSKMQASSLR